MEAIRSSEMPVNTTSTRRHIPEDCFQHNSLFSFYYRVLVPSPPITVAARSKAWTVFACSNTRFVGSNPTKGMDVCVRLFCVYVVPCGHNPYTYLEWLGHNPNFRDFVCGVTSLIWADDIRRLMQKRKIWSGRVYVPTNVAFFGSLFNCVCH
jgi:hypothetical protein